MENLSRTKGHAQEHSALPESTTLIRLTSAYHLIVCGENMFPQVYFDLPSKHNTVGCPGVAQYEPTISLDRCIIIITVDHVINIIKAKINMHLF